MFVGILLAYFDRGTVLLAFCYKEEKHVHGNLDNHLSGLEKNIRSLSLKYERMKDTGW